MEEADYLEFSYDGADFNLQDKVRVDENTQNNDFHDNEHPLST